MATPAMAGKGAGEGKVADGKFRPLFDGKTLKGWRVIPRVAGNQYPGGPSVAELRKSRGIAAPIEPEKHPAHWFVKDGYIVGEQEFPGAGYGGYLITEKSFGDFELLLEVKPDWPVDTGVMVRRRPDDWTGFQVLIDHREGGGVGGFFGNGLASFMAAPFKITSLRDGQGKVVGLQEDVPATSQEPLLPEQKARLAYAADVKDFLKAWKWGEWNEMRIRVVGAMPVITTWVNGVKIAELNTATMQAPNYDPKAILNFLGPRGHIALEVHDNDAVFKDKRWGKGAQTRYRNIRIREF
ncbi:DUF1080 domain-containing protein [Sphingobium sp. H39-3-25]|uniref:3-keto-disaccharide hydrolase n=1 Tax=Sphingobium arseniciresistens TaxID=3030834 RepID=UPI0023B9DE41|nr:DUF1080 domain-containing protein [Sphingobium arseniciresistens]